MVFIANNKFFSRYLPIILSVILLVTAGLFWYARPARAGYTYSRTIQTTAAQIPGTLANFTILVCANGAAPCDASVPGLNQSGGGAHVTDAQGDDIVFSSLSDCSSGLLNWEMEKYVAATGEMYAWVRISSLTSSTNQIYMCYGNSAITTFQGGATGTAWDSNYFSVQHYPDGTTFSPTDSIGNDTYTTINTGPAAIAAKIDGGASFSGSGSGDNRIDGNTSFAFTSITAEAWVNLPTLPSTTAIFLIVDDGPYFQLDVNTSGVLTWFTYTGSTITGPTLSTNTWYHIVAVNGELFVNGVSQGTGGTGMQNSNEKIRYFTQVYLNGAQTVKADEVRISKISRTQNWITTEYNNESNPGSFITFGSEGSLGGPAGPSGKGMTIKNVKMKIQGAKIKLQPR